MSRAVSNGLKLTLIRLGEVKISCSNLVYAIFTRRGSLSLGPSQHRLLRLYQAFGLWLCYIDGDSISAGCSVHLMRSQLNTKIRTFCGGRWHGCHYCYFPLYPVEKEKRRKECNPPRIQKFNKSLLIHVWIGLNR